MIEFSGHITGEAQERFWEKTRTLEQNLMIVCMTLSCLLFLPFGIAFGAATLVLWVYLAVLAVILIGVRIPKSQKEKDAITPKKITIDSEYIFCVTNRQEQSRRVADVKEVLDCKTYYEFVFPFGKPAAGFICQKDLLTQGTLEEFEALFEGKITDLTDYFE